MSLPLFERITECPRDGESPELRTRIFRLICATATVLCVGLIAPLNAVLDLVPRINFATLFLGAAGAFFYWQSRCGRHFAAAFVALFVVVLDLAWFWLGGPDGGVTYFFFPMLAVSVALLGGWWRLLSALGLWLNVSLLVLVAYLRPGWVTPFPGPVARLLVMEAGLVGSMAALIAVAWLILLSHERERRRVTEIASRLAASEENYREIFNSTSDALFIHSLDGRIIDVNERACVLFAADRVRFVGATLDEFSSASQPYSRKTREKIGTASPDRPEVFEWRSKRASGEPFWAEVALRVWEFGGEKRVIAAVRDISRRKRTEQQRRENEERLLLAMGASRQGWFELNVQTDEGFSSPEYARMIGYEPGEFTTSSSSWLDSIHPDDRATALKSFRDCAASGESRTVEYCRLTKSGGWKWIRSVGKIVEYDSDGKPLRMCGTHMDITDRKELEAQLLHSQRLEAVGTLASGVAHDLNNILTPMLMATGILRDKLADAHDRSLVAMLDEGGKRGAAIVRQLLAFSRNLVQDRAPVDLRELVRGMTRLMRSTFPKEITAAESVGDGRFVIEAESNQLHQVLMNLCVNARDAMPRGGTITLELKKADLPPRADAGDGSDGGGPYIRLSVADTGQGIPPEIIERIFDPFFTTKPVGKGTGLGLATVHGIVQAHNGFIRVESEPGRGTTFRIYFPIGKGTMPPFLPTLPAAEETPPPASISAKPPAGGGILVVDDDETVLFVTGRMLEVKGYEVVRAASGAAALEILRRRRDEIVLVITDFSMPEMDGPTLAPMLREILPSLRIIGVSGLSHEHRAAKLSELGFCEVLRKPYEFNDLIGAVERHFPAGP